MTSEEPLLKKMKVDEEDKNYFRSYGDINIHREMLSDSIRTQTYRRAILKNYPQIYGKVVADIGAGTGILSIFCAQAGAKKVYAVEASDMAHHISSIVMENDMQHKVTVIHGKVEEVSLPEKVDVIVSEWMGYFLLYESMLPSVLWARDRWLKKDGILLPSKASIYLAPYTESDMYTDSTEFWGEMEGTYKVKMESLKPYALKCLSHRVNVCTVSPQDINAHAVQVCKLDLSTVTESDLKHVKNNFEFNCFGHSTIYGFVSWFEVEFPQDILLTTSPFHNSTHWEQCVMYLKHPVDVEQDSQITGSIELSPSSKYNRFLDVNLKLQKGNLEEEQIYLMDDFIT